MARIAFAWELGGHFGHATACAALGHTLAVRGHRNAFVAREPGALAALNEGGFDTFRAPRVAEEGASRRPVSYADILLGCGYAHAGTLAPLVRGWLSILSSWKPDLLVEDFAPTALLAARILGLRRVRYGNGFSLPPRGTPLSAFRFDEPVSPQRLADADGAALDTVNRVLAGEGQAPMERLSELFEADEDFLCTFPELDHYDSRGTAGYWGPRFQAGSGRAMRWPARGGARIFVYLAAYYEALESVLGALEALPHRVILYVPGLDPERGRRFASPLRVVSDRPVRLDGLLREADVVVSHGGELAAGVLSAGVPQLVLPMHYEHYVTARRIEQLGAGRWLPTGAAGPAFAEAIGALASRPAYRQAARAFALRYRAFSPSEQRRRIALRIEEILA